jgi:hypothetical protein
LSPVTTTVVNVVEPRNMSSRPFVSFGTRLLAKERNATVCPFALMEGT